MITPLVYKVTADFKPFQSTLVIAESESEARIEGANRLKVPYDQTSADIVGDSEMAFAAIGRIYSIINS
jgi:hypothetical protein